MNICLQTIIMFFFCRAPCGETDLEYSLHMECSQETALFNPIIIGMTMYFRIKIMNSSSAGQKYLQLIKFLNSPTSGRCGKKLILDLSSMLSQLTSAGEEQCFSLGLMREVSSLTWSIHQFPPRPSPLGTAEWGV